MTAFERGIRIAVERRSSGRSSPILLRSSWIRPQSPGAGRLRWSRSWPRCRQTRVATGSMVLSEQAAAAIAQYEAAQAANRRAERQIAGS